MLKANNSQQEGRVILAIQAFNSGQFKSLRATAQSYKVPYMTLLDRYHGTRPRRESQPNGRKLTDLEEEVLVRHIIDLDTRGFPPRMSIVRETANLLLASHDITPPETVGKNWVTNFIQRHEELRTTYNRKYDYQRAQCEDPKIIQGWFNLVRNILAKYGILEEDIYNFDETGFQMGVIGTAKVVTSADRKGRTKSIQPGNREWVTVIHGINSYGWSLPPFIIFAAKLHQSSWYKEDEIPQDWAISVSENGWTDDKIGIDWIQHFHKHTESRTKGRFRALVMDGHGSHHTGKFEEFCREHSIITICMPPHSSHILQPLDVGCFSPLKVSYGAQIENRMRLGINHISKDEFLPAYYQAHIQAITEKNVRSSFLATGLVPFDPERVLSRLNPIVRTPSPVPTEGSSSWESKTPQTLKDIKRQGKHIQEQRRLRTNTSRSPSDTAFQQLLKGFEVAVHERAILQAEVAALRAENNHQKRKRAQRRTIVAKGGTLTVGEAQDKIYIPQLEQQIQRELPQPEPRTTEAEPSKRAPRQCSLCASTAHTARTCTLRQR
jgi:hypothetical protein